MLTPITAPTLLRPEGTPIPHGFFTRLGGVSTGPYASLNCSVSGADGPENVRENRARVAATMAIPPENLLGLKQIHSNTVISVTAPWAIGAGPEGDALVTTIPGLALGIITADCAPVLFSNPDGTVIGAAHAGWRGALAGILEATAAAMRAKGAANITAAIGPCIHQASYEVTATLRDPILLHDSTAARFFTPGRDAHWHFNLPAYCQSRLAAIGVFAEILPHDTCADEQNFFSHRRRTLRGEPAIGHQISVIKL
jgi:YfiH family protein